MSIIGYYFFLLLSVLWVYNLLLFLLWVIVTSKSDRFLQIKSRDNLNIGPRVACWAPTVLTTFIPTLVLFLFTLVLLIDTIFVLCDIHHISRICTYFSKLITIILFSYSFLCISCLGCLYTHCFNNLNLN